MATTYRLTCSRQVPCGLKYKQASLEELGKHTNPPLTKDAVAGRIRRLLALADKVAHERGIPDTESALTLDMLEED